MRWGVIKPIGGHTLAVGSSRRQGNRLARRSLGDSLLCVLRPQVAHAPAAADPFTGVQVNVAGSLQLGRHCCRRWSLPRHDVQCTDTLLCLPPTPRSLQSMNLSPDQAARVHRTAHLLHTELRLPHDDMLRLLPAVLRAPHFVQV